MLKRKILIAFYKLLQEYRQLYRTSLNSLVLPAVLVGIYYLSRRKQALNKISYEIGAPSTLRRSNLDLVGKLPITFDNGFAQSLIIENLYLRVIYKGKIIGNVSYPYKITIQPIKRTRLDTDIRISGPSLALALTTQILSQDISLTDVTIDGMVKASNINIPINKVIKLSTGTTA